MGMSKEELKEMIDSVIVSNGNGQITGNTLNQVLNAIAENAGGGDVKILFFNENMPDYMDPEYYEPFFNHNSEIYNIIVKKYTSLMQVDPNNANEWLSNVINILNDSFFKAYDILENYYFDGFLSAYASDFYFDGVEEDSESDELVVKFLNKNTYMEYGLYPNGELKAYGGSPE